MIKISRKIRSAVNWYQLATLAQTTGSREYIQLAAKSKRYGKSFISNKPPLLSDDVQTADKIVDKTGKPKPIDDKILNTVKTPDTQ